MNRRQLLTGSVAGLAAGALARIAPAAIAGGPALRYFMDHPLSRYPMTFHGLGDLGLLFGDFKYGNFDSCWYTLDGVLKSGVSPNANRIWPAEVIRDAVASIKSRLFCVPEPCLHVQAKDAVGVVQEIGLDAQPDGTTIVCLMKWLKPQHPAFDQIARIERRLCLSGIGTCHRDGGMEIIDDFRICNLICGERR